VEDIVENMKKSNAIPVLGKLKEDFDEYKGIACVGAINYLQNLNMRFRPTDERKYVIQIAKYLRDPDVSLRLGHTQILEQYYL
jgi:hypothetical protein